jgi:hypothetical protein
MAIDRLSQSPHGIALLISRSFRGLILLSGKVARAQIRRGPFCNRNHTRSLNPYRGAAILLGIWHTSD